MPSPLTIRVLTGEKRFSTRRGWSGKYLVQVSEEVASLHPLTKVCLATYYLPPRDAVDKDLSYDPFLKGIT